LFQTLAIGLDVLVYVVIVISIFPEGMGEFLKRVVDESAFF